ncbi:NB-ARC domain-containing protein [Streptomyces sp. NPDC050610]|uniref:ATP-binding protein n=1 Tax=Streptomyces sp. NPDC050610 TaxID=3157097 RepID=UPI003426EBCD
MDPFTMTAVLSALNTVGQGAMSGAAGELGRRTSEGLAGLVRRLWHRGEDGSPDDSTGPLAAPADDAERRRLAALLIEEARREPGFADDLAAWLRAARWLEPAALTSVARPRLLPPGTAVFTDRDQVLADITALLDSGGDDGDDGDGDGDGSAASGSVGPRIVALVGPGGIGKSATAIHCARALEERFPDGQLHTDLKGDSARTAVAPSTALVRFLTGLGVTPDRMPADEQGQADLYRDCTAGRRMVVVLDNAHSAAQLMPLLTAAPGSLVIVTSRHRLPELVRDYGARVIRLDPLTAADSVRLLTRIVGAERVAPHRPHAEAVAARCGGLPLALCETGARVAVREHLNWEALEREFARRDDRLPGEPTDMNDPADDDPAHRATDLSYRDLAAPAARLYRLLGLCPWPGIPVGAAAAAAGIGEAEARRLLEALAEVHLLEEVGEERYRFHDVVRRHAERRAHEEDGRRGTADAVRRMALWYLRFAAAADAQVIPGRWHLGPAYAQSGSGGGHAFESARTALAALRREHENLAEAVRAAEEYGFDELVWQLCEATWSLHLRLGLHEQWVATHRRGVRAAARCAEEFGDRRAEGRMRAQLAFAYLGRGQLADAAVELAAAAAADERAGHRRGQATAVESLGLVRLRQWRYEEAEEDFRQAKGILRGIAPGEDGERDVPRALALLEHHIGRALRGQGRHADAVRQLRYALSQFHDLRERDPYNEARVRMSLGETLLAAGEPAAARTPLDEALAVLDSEGAVLQQADAAELRAACAKALADAADEARQLRAARGLYEASGDGAAVARVDARLSELT